MTQVIPFNLTLPSCSSDGSRRSNNPAEKHISVQDFGKWCRISSLGAACICFSVLLCTFALYWGGKPKWECEQLIYGFSFSFSHWQKASLWLLREAEHKSCGQWVWNCFFFCWLQHRCHLIWWLVVMGNLCLNNTKKPSPCRTHRITGS